MSGFRELLLAAARAHAMWPTAGDADAGLVCCSCGFSAMRMWLDDVVWDDVRSAGHEDAYVIAYPIGVRESAGGVQFERVRLDAPDLTWLLAHDDLPLEFRRAAAVHLQK